MSIIIFVVEKQKQNQAQDSFQLSKLHAPWAVIGQWFAPLLPWYSEILMEGILFVPGIPKLNVALDILTVIMSVLQVAAGIFKRVMAVAME